MEQIEKYGITFNTYKTAGVEYDQWPLILTGQQGPDEEGGIINAVDIDWNGADWSSIPTDQETPSEINTTADLLKAIKYASEVGGTTEVGEQGLSHKFN